jgi:hypothetical protein
VVLLTVTVVVIEARSGREGPTPVMLVMLVGQVMLVVRSVGVDASPPHSQTLSKA